ncbi:hypothetical protein V2J09_016760 [Rumex salicifolius]
MEGSPYCLMGDGRNALLVGGCNGGAVVVRERRKETVAVGCATACIKNAHPASRPNRTCYGLECCQSVIPTFHDFVEMNFLNFVHQDVMEAVVAVVLDLSYVQGRKVDRNLSQFEGAPTLLHWRIEDLKVNDPKYANSLCVKERDGGYTCTCRRDYFHGNPYLPDGCKAVKACEQCPDNCASPGNNKFYCPSPPPPDKNSVVLTPKLALGLGIPVAAMFMIMVSLFLYHILKKRKEFIKKKRNFKRNGGLLLHQQTRTGDNSIERTKLFTSNELEKATDEFNENRVLGRGGQGTVYKGMLVDGSIVAIKKSKKVSETQLQQFINEVVILSQVNHRNVVKLFGCCLETDVPLLVYEYVPNGTLYEHLHKPYEDFRITWKMRLQIVTDSAEALAYLHSWSFAPIYHRDIKTSNILLDDKYKAKVADFGTSKTLSMDQSHVTTHVQGTIGYMDPEFIQSSQFTEKSDVYSFGIVILELLTSKKAIFWDNPGEPKRLASEFLDVMENSRLYEFVDKQVLEEAQEQEIESVADLARRCLNLNGKERPTMKKVAVTLQMISSPIGAPNNTSQQEFLSKSEMNVEKFCTTNEGLLSTSSSYGPR